MGDRDRGRDVEGWCGGRRDRGHLQDGERAVEPGMRQGGDSRDNGVGPLPGEDKRPGTSWLVGRLGCQAVGASVRLCWALRERLLTPGQFVERGRQRRWEGG